MRALLLGARGAIGSVIRRELERGGHIVSIASRSAPGDAGVDLRGDLSPLARLTSEHDVVVNASGIENTGIAEATNPTPLIDISASGAYLEELRARAPGPVVLGAGLAPGLSTILIADLVHRPGDDIDVLVMLGSGEQHGAAAVDWTAGLIGAEVHRPPEREAVRNLLSSRREIGPDGRRRRYLRADFPDHVLLGDQDGPAIRSYLALSSATMTSALGAIARLPSLRGALGLAPHAGTDAWHVLVRNRRTGERAHAQGSGQSEATGRLAALAARRAVETGLRSAATMADLVTPDDARSALEEDAPR